jgi:hypothetical protein
MHGRNGKMSVRSRINTRVSRRQKFQVTGLRNAITQPIGSTSPTAGMGVGSGGPDSKQPREDSSNLGAYIIGGVVLSLVIYVVLYTGKP